MAILQDNLQNFMPGGNGSFIGSPRVAKKDDDLEKGKERIGRSLNR